MWSTMSCFICFALFHQRYYSEIRLESCTGHRLTPALASHWVIVVSTHLLLRHLPTRLALSVGWVEIPRISFLIPHTTTLHPARVYATATDSCKTVAVCLLNFDCYRAPELTTGSTDLSPPVISFAKSGFISLQAPSIHRTSTIKGDPCKPFPWTSFVPSYFDGVHVRRWCCIPPSGTWVLLVSSSTELFILNSCLCLLLCSDS